MAGARRSAPATSSAPTVLAAPCARCSGIRCDSLGSEGNHLATLFRADLSAVVSGIPHALTAIVAPGLEGMFVPTGESRPLDLRHRVASRGRRDAGRLAGRADGGADPSGGRACRTSSPTLIGMFPWDFGAAVAQRQRSGRAFLVGDAAHRTTPRGATGMNTGIADGHNLGWKLAWVVRGWAGEALLDSYEAERAGVGRANAQASLQTASGRPAEPRARSGLRRGLPVGRDARDGPAGRAPCPARLDHRGRSIGVQPRSVRRPADRADRPVRRRVADAGRGTGPGRDSGRRAEPRSGTR